jgi:hypothetical protein
VQATTNKKITILFTGLTHYKLQLNILSFAILKKVKERAWDLSCTFQMHFEKKMSIDWLLFGIPQTITLNDSRESMENKTKSFKLTH